MAHFEPKTPLQLASQVRFALRAVGITNDYEYRELHEFFMALFVQFGQFVHIRVFSCFKFVKLDSQYFEPCRFFLSDLAHWREIIVFNIP